MGLSIACYNHGVDSSLLHWADILDEGTATYKCPWTGIVEGPTPIGDRECALSLLEATHEEEDARMVTFYSMDPLYCLLASRHVL